jgi:hypothetical protein
MFIATFQRRLRTPLGVQCELLVEPQHIASIVKLKHSFSLNMNDGQNMALLKECEILSTICGYKHRTPNGVSAFPRDGKERLTLHLSGSLTQLQTKATHRRVRFKRFLAARFDFICTWPD